LNVLILFFLSVAIGLKSHPPFGSGPHFREVPLSNNQKSLRRYKIFVHSRKGFILIWSIVQKTGYAVSEKSIYTLVNLTLKKQGQKHL